MVENNIHIRKAISKSELADRYGVHIETLRMWIVNNSKLLEELQSIGYNKNKKLLNPKELQIIEKYLGF